MVQPATLNSSCQALPIACAAPAASASHMLRSMRMHRFIESSLSLVRSQDDHRQHADGLVRVPEARRRVVRIGAEIVAKAVAGKEYARAHLEAQAAHAEEVAEADDHVELAA